MTRRSWIQKTVLAGVAALGGSFALLSVPAPAASAAPCPDVEVVFARGSGEPPGLGQVGGPFVDALTPELGARSLGVYAVNYEASTDFSSPDFPKSVVNGIRDAGAHIQSMAANCPKTREVLGGYSQGAAVAGFVTAATIPPGVPAGQVPKPLPPEIANHVAAVTLFGTPSENFLNQYGAPQITIGPLYQAKTIELCAPGDGICGDGDNPIAHVSYPMNGMVSQGADFAASHL
jgi:cutinase